jgi:hypothetical protein
VEVAAVRTRLSELQGLRLPSTITDPRLQEYVDAATGELLTAAGRTSAPSAGVTRSALENLCLDLVVAQVRRDLYGLQSDMVEALGRDIDRILARATAFAEKQEGGGLHFHVTGVAD